MISPRKLFWPSVLALGFLLFFGTVSSTAPGVAAATGDNRICQINGPLTMTVGDVALYNWRVQDNREDTIDITTLVEDQYTVQLDMRGGARASILAVSNEDDPADQGDYQLTIAEFRAVGPTRMVSAVDVTGPNEIDPELYEWLDVRYGFEIEGNPCGISILEVSDACIDEGFCSVWDNSTSAEREAWAEAIEDATAAGVVDCLDLLEIGEDAFLDAGGLQQELDGIAGVGGINGYWLAVCDFAVPTTVGPVLDDIGFFVVQCTVPGTFTISIADNYHFDSEFQRTTVDADSIEVTCYGAPAGAKMSGTPTPIEIVPALGSVSHSLITVEVTDSNGEDLDGAKVTFTTDRCSIESSAVDTTNEYESADAVHDAYTRLAPSTAFAVDQHVSSTTAPDSSSPKQEEVYTDEGIAATVLHCNALDAPGVTPGPAKVTAIIQTPGDDFVLSLVIVVVGPPAPNGLSATGAPAKMICGEKAQIEATVRDAIGQMVSDHTLVEVVTNYGGVLGGTGAVAGQAGPVVPLSSTVAETYGGKANFVLLTSDLHVGTYEVVITTGGGAGVTGSNQGGTGGLLGGLWTTAPVSVQLSFECTQPSTAAAPSISAPATGQGIKPPSTGDAGLIGFSDGSTPWILGGIVALIAAAFISARFARD